jgi:hypothetical protein
MNTVENTGHRRRAAKRFERLQDRPIVSFFARAHPTAQTAQVPAFGVGFGAFLVFFASE